jgi:hypothetical protein
MSEQDEAMTDLLAAVRFIWANCHRLGLADDEADALALMKEIAGAKPDLAEPTLRAQIEPLASVLVLDPGATAQLQVRVINQSSITFRNHVLQPGLSYHVLDDSGTVVQWDGPRVWFSSPLRPGGEQIVTIPVAAGRR